MEVKTEIAGSDYTHATGASKAGSAYMVQRKYSYDIGNGNRSNNGRSYNHIGKGSNNNNNNNNNVVDILDLAVPQSKVRPIDRLLDRYDWSSVSMMPLLQNSDRPQRTQDDQPLSLPGRSAPSPPIRPQAPRRPLPPRPPPTRPPKKCALEFSDLELPVVRKSPWKRTRELVSSFFVRAAAAVHKVNCCWSR
ncbi:ras guanine nucleotide exchange factor P-like [Myzus persicae]|uniref:ras guanine nucleotide exchange factor P-like n=1 Tax=Myzus persicae TaxID=13164 RepID=UPI000B9322AF|nr:ras guanine nucleotide exchange factor P-like [Myzus persicae]XP_022173055.1 ras guanine nucleotide exchange factor P-like [Myzus persicae]